MSERPSWKKPPKPPPNDVVTARTKEIEDRGREPSITNRANQRGGAGTPRSVIYSQKMAIPKKRRKK